MIDNFKIIDNKKYMWDGEEYETITAAQQNIQKYMKDDFQTKLVEEEGKYLIYTRREVKEIVVEGTPV